jgi:hypothetical protein
MRRDDRKLVSRLRDAPNQCYSLDRVTIGTMLVCCKFIYLTTITRPIENILAGKVRPQTLYGMRNFSSPTAGILHGYFPFADATASCPEKRNTSYFKVRYQPDSEPEMGKGGGGESFGTNCCQHSTLRQ